MCPALLLGVVFSLAFVPAPEPRPPRGDLHAIQGTWVQTALLTQQELRLTGQTTILITGNQMRFDDSTERRITLGPKKNPKTLDLTSGSRKQEFIYQVDGDTLKICWHLSGAKRPSRMDGTEEGTAVMVFLRKRP